MALKYGLSKNEADIIKNDGKYIYVVIGNKVDIEQTYEKIKRDQRHQDIVTIISEDTEELLFDDWVMSYVSEDAYKQIVEPIVKSETFKRALEVLKQVSLHL